MDLIDEDSHCFCLFLESFHTITTEECQIQCQQKRRKDEMIKKKRIPYKIYITKQDLTIDVLEIEMGWLLALPLDTLTGRGSSSSNEGNRGVSGGVNSLLGDKQLTYHDFAWLNYQQQVVWLCYLIAAWIYQNDSKRKIRLMGAIIIDYITTST